MTKMNPLPRIQSEQRDWSKSTKNIFICWYVNTKIIFRTAEKKSIAWTNGLTSKRIRVGKCSSSNSIFSDGSLNINIILLSVAVAIAVAWHLWLGLVWFFSFLVMACAHGARTHNHDYAVWIWICSFHLINIMKTKNTYGVCHHPSHTHSRQVLVKRYQRMLEQSVMASILMWTSASGWVSACLWILLVYIRMVPAILAHPHSLCVSTR